jgi:hypothetical protein
MEGGPPLLLPDASSSHGEVVTAPHQYEQRRLVGGDSASITALAATLLTRRTGRTAALRRRGATLSGRAVSLPEFPQIG